MAENKKSLSGYELSRNWFDFCFENPDIIKPIHSAIYFFAIEHCNRLGWKPKFGFPSQMVMEAIGVKNWRTYSKALTDLVGFGFIMMIEISKNQYSSNIIAIVKNTKAQSKALDKALQKHSTKQGQSTVSIDKQDNKEQITNKHLFEKSPYFDINKLKSEIGDKYQKYDIDYYHESARIYSESKGAKYLNWKSTIQGFMRRDDSENKAKLGKRKNTKLS